MSASERALNSHPVEHDLYQLLNVTRDVTPLQLRTSFRKLSQLYHPDKHVEPAAKSTANERFTAIKEAYEILSDDKLRSIYDEFGLANAREAASPAMELTPYVDLLGRFRAEAAARDSARQPGGSQTPRDAYFTIINSAEARVDGTGLVVALEDGFYDSNTPIAVVSQVALSSMATAYVSQDTTLMGQYSTASARRNVSPSGVGEFALIARHQLSQYSTAELSAHMPLENPKSSVYAAQATRSLDRYTQMSIKSVFDPSSAEATTTLSVGRSLDDRNFGSVNWSTGAVPGVSFSWRRLAYDEYLPENLQRKSSSDEEDDDDEEEEIDAMRSDMVERLHRLYKRAQNFVEPCGLKFMVKVIGAPALSVGVSRPVGGLFPLFEPCDAIGPGGGSSVKLRAQIGLFGWEVEAGGGERYIMNDTAWNMAVACGTRGVVWKVKVERGGHRFVLPVVLVSATSDAKTATLAAIASSLLVTAIQSLIVRPIVKLREAEEKAEAREIRRETMEKAQKEAEAAAALLARQVATIRKNEEDVVIDGNANAGLLVERAVYGVKEVVNRFKFSDPSLIGREVETEAIEVTASVQALVEGSSVQVVSSTKSTLLGFWDPSAVGDKEELALKVWYKFKGELHLCVVEDMDALELPLSNHKVRSWN